MKKHTRVLLPFLVFLFFAGPLQVFGQGKPAAKAPATPKKPTEEDVIKKIVSDFAKAYEGITTTSDINTVLSFASPKLRSTNISSDVSGKLSLLNGTYKDFSDYLEKMRLSDGLEISYKITSIPSVTVRQNIATAVYLVDYEFKQDGSLWSRGSETVLMTFEKIEEEWKIVFFNFMGVEDEKLKGACLCELYVAKTGNYVAKTTVPAGKSYNTSLNTFEFRAGSGTDRIIKVEGLVYIWNGVGDIYLESTGADSRSAASPQIIGSAIGNRDDAVTTIIQKSLFRDNCFSFNFRRTRE